MNRRGFLQRIIGGSIAVAVAASVPLKFLFPEKAEVYATIGEYNDYASFSQLAIAESMDKVVQDSAIQLGYAAGQSISELYRFTYDS